MGDTLGLLSVIQTQLMCSTANTQSKGPDEERVDLGHDGFYPSLQDATYSTPQRHYNP